MVFSEKQVIKDSSLRPRLVCTQSGVEDVPNAESKVTPERSRREMPRFDSALRATIFLLPVSNMIYKTYLAMPKTLGRCRNRLHPQLTPSTFKTLMR